MHFRCRVGHRYSAESLLGEQTEALNEARRRFYDGKHLALPALEDWSWHITCVRDSRSRDLEALRQAASELHLDMPWRIDTVSYMQLAGQRYEELARWQI